MRIHHPMIRPALAAACVMACLAGCSSNKGPREQLAVSAATVDSAQTAGANELASVELTRARDKLAQAKIAMQDKNYVLARRLAEEADADAQVARSKANAERSQKAADEVTASLRTLRNELDKPLDGVLMPTAPAAGVPAMPPSTRP